VRDAGDELTDRRQLLGLQQLRLRRLQPLERCRQLRVRFRELLAHVLQPSRRARLFGDVLRNLHDRGADGQAVDRKRRDAEDLLIRESDLRSIHIVAGQRAAHGAIRKLAAAETDFPARGASNLGDRTADLVREREVPAQQVPLTIEYRDRIADRVERPFPFLLAAPNRIVQPRVLNRDDDLPRDDREQPLVSQLETARARCPHRQRAEQLVTCQKRQADAAAQDQIRPRRHRHVLREVLEHDRRPRGEHLFGRPRRRFAPELLQPRRPDRRRHLVRAGAFIAQAHGRADRVERARDALQGAREHVIELERAADALGNLVDRLQLPEQTTVVNRHLVDEQGRGCLCH
jgi:hypothetical protein